MLIEDNDNALIWNIRHFPFSCDLQVVNLFTIGKHWLD